MGNATSAKSYNAVQAIGQGGFGSVEKVERSGKYYAKKTIKYGGFTPSTIDMVRKEIMILGKLNHPHIVKLIESWEERGRVYGGKGCIIMPFYEHGSARCFAPHPKLKALPLPKALQIKVALSFSLIMFINAGAALTFLDQMLDALVYIHGNGIIHRDIKLENVLIDFPNDGFAEVPHIAQNASFYLVDFGISTGRLKNVDQSSTCSPTTKGSTKSVTSPSLSSSIPEKVQTILTTSCAGTTIYMAPEQFKGQGYGKSADTFSLGIASLELLFGRSIIAFGTNNDGREMNSNAQFGCLATLVLLPALILPIMVLTIAMWRLIIFRVLFIMLTCLAAVTIQPFAVLWIVLHMVLPYPYARGSIAEKLDLVRKMRPLVAYKNVIVGLFSPALLFGGGMSLYISLPVGCILLLVIAAITNKKDNIPRHVLAISLLLGVVISTWMADLAPWMVLFTLLAVTSYVPYKARSPLSCAELLAVLNRPLLRL